MPTYIQNKKFEAYVGTGSSITISVDYLEDWQLSPRITDEWDVLIFSFNVCNSF